MTIAIKQILALFADLGCIWRKKYIGISAKIKLSVVTLKIRFKNFFYKRTTLGFLDFTSEKFLGRQMTFPDYYSFSIQFRECFIEDSYYFKADTHTPFIIDCGSNIGMTILYFKWLYPESEILGFEPSPSTFHYVKENTKQCTKVTLVQKGLAAEEGSVSFYNDDERPGLSTSHKESLMDDRIESGNISEITIETTRLSPYLDRSIDMLKIDIEGMEAEVLLEAENSLPSVNAISLEYHRMENNKLSDVIRCLEPHFTLLFSDSQPYHVVLSCEKKDKYGGSKAFGKA